MPISAVVDASVLVSAFLFPRSIPGEVLSMAEQGRYGLYLSPILIEETRRSLMSARLLERYGHNADEVVTFCKDLSSELSFMITELPEIGPVCRDPDDDHVIAAGMAAKADYIVTGDKDLLTLERHGDIQIITAREFLDRMAASS